LQRQRRQPEVKLKILKLLIRPQANRPSWFALRTIQSFQISYIHSARDGLRCGSVKYLGKERESLLSSRQITNDIPQKRQHLKQGRNNGEQRGSESESEIYRKKEGKKVDGREGKSFAGEQVFQMRLKSPQKGKGGDDEERAEGEEKRKLSGFEQKHRQVERGHAEANDAAHEAKDESQDTLLSGQPARAIVLVRR